MSAYKKNILAVDDDVTILTAIRSILAGNYDVSLAKNTDIAGIILGKTRVDLILLDMEMPGTSGMDFLNVLRNSPVFYSIPVIIVSSHGTEDVIREVQKTGAVDFVVKPISPKILMEKVQSGFDLAKKKISKANLVKKLQLLESYCAKGKSSDIETSAADLGHYSFNLQTDNRINQIFSYTRKMEYDIADEELKKLISELS